MIRRVLASGYAKTVGAAKGWLWGFVDSSTGRGGLLQVLYVLVIVGLMAGFINAIVFPVPSQGFIIYPSGGAQSVAEAIINAFVIVVGGAGIYLAYLSGKQTTRTRTVNLYLGLSLLLIIVSILTGLQVAIIKGY
ncbi:MAG: hypothetical protein HY247_06220 [archaeon]|nr:MAG: hypothetical protein HY247_06220 [archaeon]